MFGKVEIQHEEQVYLRNALNMPLSDKHISTRPCPGGGTVAYLEGWKSFSLANDLFGFNGWSSTIVNMTVDYSDTDNQGRHHVGVSCVVRVYLRDGSYHDDIGYGASENQRSKGSAYEKAKKEAVTDATKRALRLFGSALGNCTYDKGYIEKLRKGRLSENESFSHTDNLNVPRPVYKSILPESSILNSFACETPLPAKVSSPNDKVLEDVSEFLYSDPNNSFLVKNQSDVRPNFKSPGNDTRHTSDRDSRHQRAHSSDRRTHSLEKENRKSVENDRLHREITTRRSPMTNRGQSRVHSRPPPELTSDSHRNHNSYHYSPSGQKRQRHE